MDNNNAPVLNMSGSLMTTDTYETTSNPPGSVRSFSIFGDSVCGEPLLAQHLVVDFTPKEEIDTDFTQNKVCAFWQFVDVRPELKDILVLPETDLFKMSDSSDILPDVEKHEKTQFVNTRSMTKELTAESMLEFIEEKGNSYQGQVKCSKRTQTTDFRRTKHDADIRKMCKGMQQWDEQHPKCMQCLRYPHTIRQRRQKKTS